MKFNGQERQTDIAKQHMKVITKLSMLHLCIDTYSWRQSVRAFPQYQKIYRTERNE